MQETQLQSPQTAGPTSPQDDTQALAHRRSRQAQSQQLSVGSSSIPQGHHSADTGYYQIRTNNKSRQVCGQKETLTR